MVPVLNFLIWYDRKVKSSQQNSQDEPDFLQREAAKISTCRRKV
jgi:hypothetical protein